ncbi:MAG: hypothetical protein MR894_05350 [Akkermansia muciniphila]|nr:hypothetical protein [Akkermansia muciniphila]
MKTRLLSLFLAALAVVFTFSACGGGGADTEPGVITTEDFLMGRKYFYIYAGPIVTIRTTLGADNELPGAEHAPAEGSGRHIQAFGCIAGQPEVKIGVFYRYEGDHKAIMNLSDAETGDEGGGFVLNENAPDFIRVLAAHIAGSDNAERVTEISQLRFDFSTMLVSYRVRVRTGAGRDDYREVEGAPQFAVIRQQS